MKSYKLYHRKQPIYHIFAYDNLTERIIHKYNYDSAVMDGDCILARIPKSKLIRTMYAK